MTAILARAVRTRRVFPESAKSAPPSMVTVIDSKMEKINGGFWDILGAGIGLRWIRNRVQYAPRIYKMVYSGNKWRTVDKVPSNMSFEIPSESM
ncbi:hypothetical protein Y032_0039g59 [Ancylostoma ceylanicum]|uniref:Uncharacterized protein n=1 Tax=Ancylostoma ceylanicum TaxID=53326 RepID=A0A016UHN6_9BILA|nr:hypothetical protein Y032_0039g59 [Ancylostoma ceylanicum]